MLARLIGIAARPGLTSPTDFRAYVEVFHRDPQLSSRKLPVKSSFESDLPQHSPTTIGMACLSERCSTLSCTRGVPGAYVLRISVQLDPPQTPDTRSRPRRTPSAPRPPSRRGTPSSGRPAAVGVRLGLRSRLGHKVAEGRQCDELARGEEVAMLVSCRRAETRSSRACSGRSVSGTSCRHRHVRSSYMCLNSAHSSCVPRLPSVTIAINCAPIRPALPSEHGCNRMGLAHR